MTARTELSRIRVPVALHRRSARDYSLPARSEAMIQLAMTDLMARRLTDENTARRTPRGTRSAPGAALPPPP
ncbi:hypothetical protein AB0M58_25860 [Streptomyces bobili]|uniref:hypothetical protein n=1 Tax=Streptomyces TaxID=1883 RepID=UPI001E2EEB85|nr:hypothetical protein [Streptomyces galilaeus]